MGKGLVILHIVVQHQGTIRQKFKSRLEGEYKEECCSWFDFSHSSATFLKHPRITYSKVALTTVGWAFLNHLEDAPQTSP